VVSARERGAAGDVGLRGCDVVAQWGGAGGRLGARIPGLEHAALDFDAGRDPRRVRTHLDDDLAAVSQPEPDDRGQVPGSEDLIGWRAAQMLHTPPGKASTIHSMRAR
jgi:hypothetical protein